MITSVALSPDGARLLASWSGHHVFQFGTECGLSWPDADDGISLSFCSGSTEFGGHCNRRTIKECAYVGGRAELVASGSDDGRLFLWHASSGALAGLGEGGDSFVVNSVAPHPRDLCLATGGIDSCVKVWAPTSAEPRRLSGPEVEEVCRRNELRGDAAGFPFLLGGDGLGDDDW
mmetsp:Transcript_70678/g.189554  ORF Transcript_70678/g.189554 Transcript_70678/m.189554 type:complete len:175 (+) Transcript_70678:3-527(+)